MRRTKTAVASDEGFLGRENPLEGMGSLREEVDEMLICCGNCFYKCFDGVPG